MGIQNAEPGPRGSEQNEGGEAGGSRVSVYGHTKAATAGRSDAQGQCGMRTLTENARRAGCAVIEWYNVS
jgi:hypothetical protein